jgi:hypothetical protein
MLGCFVALPDWPIQNWVELADVGMKLDLKGLLDHGQTKEAGLNRKAVVPGC